MLKRYEPILNSSDNFYSVGPSTKYVTYYQNWHDIPFVRLLCTLCARDIWTWEVTSKCGRALAQAVSRRLPTAAARARARVRSCGICGGQSDTGAGFLRVLRFPLPISVPPTASQSPSSIIWGWYNRSVVAAVPSGLSLTPLRIIIKKYIEVFFNSSHSHLSVE
jgi:hypothetical protein